MTDHSNPTHKGPALKSYLPWVVTFIAVLAVDRLVDYRIVHNGVDLAGLEDNTLYTYETTPDLCVNQAVYVRLNGRRPLLTIGAIAGGTLPETATELLRSNAAANLDEHWQNKANSEIADLDLTTIPEAHVLIINSNYQHANTVTDTDSSDWAIALVPETDVGASLTKVLFSRNVSRIGQPAKELGDCMRRTSTD